MKIVETYEFVIPVWAVMGIEYPLEAILEPEEEKALGVFLAKLPNGVWEYSDDKYWAGYNDVTRRKLEEVCEAKLIVLE